MDNAIGFRNTYPCQDWIVIHPVDSSVQLTSIWNQMDKFIPRLNFKPIVTQHMLWHARCITQFTQNWQCLCYFLWKPCLYWNSIYFGGVLILFFFFWRDNSRRVRTHEKNTWDSVCRLGIIIQRFFVPNQEPAFAWPFGWKWYGGSVPRGSSARAWKLSSRLFSRPVWLPLGLRRWSTTC